MKKTTSFQLLMCVMVLAAVMMTATGCKHRTKPVIEPEIQKTAEKTTGNGQPDVDLENLLFSEEKGLQRVYFDYDSFALRPDALKTLADNADKVKQVPKVIIQIEGHCDERGTQEYNLALGEKRALAVRDHLIKLGVSGDRLVTISYGKERPAVEGHDESAWQKNRRSQFNRAVSK